MPLKRHPFHSLEEAERLSKELARSRAMIVMGAADQEDKIAA